MAYSIMTLEVTLEVKATMKCHLEMGPGGSATVTADEPVFELQDPEEIIEGSERVFGHNSNPFPFGSQNYAAFEKAVADNAASEANVNISQLALDKARREYGQNPGAHDHPMHPVWGGRFHDCKPGEDHR